jgi:hypothetical protein
LFNAATIAMPASHVMATWQPMLIGYLKVQKYEVAVHAWVFMTNHIHLLLTNDQALPQYGPRPWHRRFSQPSASTTNLTLAFDSGTWL